MQLVSPISILTTPYNQTYSKFVFLILTNIVEHGLNEQLWISLIWFVEVMLSL